MAIEAGPRHGSILQDGRLFEIAQIALIDAHLAVDLIARGDEPVGESPFAEWVVGDLDGEVAVLFPLSALPGIDREGELSSLVGLCELVPVVYVEVGVIAMGLYLPLLGSSYGDEDGLHAIPYNVEVERRDVYRYRRSRVVGEDVGLLVDQRGVGGL